MSDITSLGTAAGFHGAGALATKVTVRWAQTSMGEKRHEFLQGDGSWKRCAGARYCRECIRIQTARKAKRG